MDRKKSSKLLEAYGRPAFKAKGSKNVLVFARQNMKNVREIERMTNPQLIERWKGLTWTNSIYGQVSLNDMQRIQLLELEMDTRKRINFDELNDWFETAQKKFEKEQDMF